MMMKMIEMLIYLLDPNLIVIPTQIVLKRHLLALQIGKVKEALQIGKEKDQSSFQNTNLLSLLENKRFVSVLDWNR